MFERNLVILSGRLSKDPELKYIPNSGKSVTTFDIAVENKYLKESENKADFFRIQCWGNLAESVAENLTKGRKVLINGVLRNNHWTDENNNYHRQEVVIATRIEYLDYSKNNDLNYEYTPPNIEEVEGELPF